MGALEQADTDRPALRILFPEQRILHLVRRNRGRVDDDERPFHTGRTLVDQPRRQLLADTGRARDQHARIRRRHFLDRGPERGGRLAVADPALFITGAVAQRGVLVAKRGRFDGALHDQHQPVRLDRLLDEVERAAPDGRDGGLYIAVAADHDDRQDRVDRLQIFQKRQAIHAAALQPDIEDHQTRRARPDFFQRAFCRVGGAHRIALIAEHAGHQFPDIRLIIYD